MEYLEDEHPNDQENIPTYNIFKNNQNDQNQKYSKTTSSHSQMLLSVKPLTTKRLSLTLSKISHQPATCLSKWPIPNTGNQMLELLLILMQGLNCFSHPNLFINPVDEDMFKLLSNNHWVAITVNL